MGWSVISILYWVGLIDQQVVIIWFMTYDAYFPRREAPTSPGASPPPMILCMLNPDYYWFVYYMLLLNIL